MRLAATLSRGTRRRRQRTADGRRRHHGDRDGDIHFHLQASTPKRSTILLNLPSDIIDRSAFMYSILDSGWIRIAYRKDDGSTAIRLGTRNPTLVAKYGSSYDVTGIKNSEFDSHSVHTVLYFDHMAGALRCFRVKNVDGAGIDAESFENNH